MVKPCETHFSCFFVSVSFSVCLLVSLPGADPRSRDVAEDRDPG
jgi:hypothetical protein